MKTLKVNVFNFLNKSKKMTVPLVPLCPTFPYISNMIQDDSPGLSNILKFSNSILETRKKT